MVGVSGLLCTSACICHEESGSDYTSVDFILSISSLNAFQETL